ncbi:MAG: chemotaxis protein CheR [Desulfuromonadia bacterium]
MTRHPPLTISPAETVGDPPLTLWRRYLFHENPPVDGGEVDRLSRLFRRYVTSYPFVAWRPGGVITDEMHRQTEALLPLSEVIPPIRRVVDALLTPPTDGFATILTAASSWLSVCQRLESWRVDPSAIISPLLRDPRHAMAFLSRWYIPRRHGGSPGRYPGQLRFIHRWLSRREGEIALLDAACGTGEGVYDLAAAARDAGIPPEQVTIVGETLAAVEVISAASGVIVHDPERTSAFSRVRGELEGCGLLERILFSQHDIREEGGGGYDLIICNGLIGGPLLHHPDHVARLVGVLSRRLKPGGLLLAADRFHGGWHRRIAPSFLVGVMKGAGLSPFDPGEGIGGVTSSG